MRWCFGWGGHAPRWALALVLLALGCRGPAPAAPPDDPLPPAPPAAVHVAESGLVSDALFYIGQERGYFAEQSIRLELMRLERAQIGPALASGAIDVGIVGVSSALFQALARGDGPLLVADAGRASPRQSDLALSVREELLASGRVRELADLRGLTIGLSGRGGASALFVGKALESGRLGRGDVQLVEVRSADQQTAFASRAIDAAMQAEPFATLSQRQALSRKWKTAGEIAGDSPLRLLQYSSALANQQRPVAQRFMLAYTRAARDYYDAFVGGRDTRAPIVDLLVRHTTVTDPTLYDEMGMFGIDPNPYVDAAGLSAQQDWLLAQGLLPELRAPVDVNAHVERQFVNRALGLLGPYR